MQLAALTVLSVYFIKIVFLEQESKPDLTIFTIFTAKIKELHPEPGYIFCVRDTIIFNDFRIAVSEQKVQ